MLLNSGIASFQKRIDIIRKALNNIEVEYFIYGTDHSSKLLTQELVNAAERGVTVRVLIDKSAAVFVFDEHYAEVLKEQGVEVRYYNPAPMIQVSSINFRNHRKLISVDDKFAITGGRNIGDDYYDLSKSFNFLDRDVYIEGDIVKTMRESFDEYFNHKISERPEKTISPPARVLRKRAGGKVSVWVDNSKAINEYKEKVKAANDFIIRTEEDKKALERIAEVSLPILAQKKIHSCPELTFSTDRPGGNFLTRLVESYSDDFRYLRKTLFDKANEATKEITISSPYMINNHYSRKQMNELLMRGTKLKLYTNSLASTDAVYVAANLYKDYLTWRVWGVELYMHDGRYVDENEVFSEEVKKAKWGTHSKTQVYKSEDHTEIMIGTYNIDNRSNHYNTEMAIFCRGNDELTQELEDNIQSRMNSGYKMKALTAVAPDGTTKSIFGATRKDLLKMVIIALPSWLLRPLL